MKHSEEYVRKLEEENNRLKLKLDLPDKTFFRAMFESHQAVMLLIEPHSGKITDANAAAVNFYKYPKEKLLQLKIQDINKLPPIDVERERMKALKEERNYFIFPHQLGDGQIRRVEVYSTSFQFNNSRMLFSIIHDITEREDAEEALRKSEEKFAATFMSNPNSVALSDLETGEIYDVNDAFTRLIGLPREEIVGKNSTNINFYVSNEDRKRILRTLEQDGFVRNMEIKLRHSSGKPLIVLLSSEILKTSSGKTILTTIQDISERVRLVQQLRRKHALLQTIIDSVPAMISVYDSDLQEIQLNNEVERVTGWTRKEWKKHGIMELVYPDPEYRKEVSDYMYSLNPGYKEIVMTGKDGSKIDTIWANSVMTDGRQVGIGIDIRERKKIEQQLQENNEHLQRVNEVLEDFVKIAAHDLRGPIANLININELIQKQPNIEGKLMMFDMLAPITNRLQRTVDGLLETVSLQTSEQITIKNIAVNQLWKEVSEELSTMIDNYKGRVETDFSNAPTVSYVEVHLMSILRNLVSNALKYSAQQENPFVRITTKKEGHSVLLTVRDNGIGIDLEKEGKNLFKPFQRFTSTAEGTGMGLYIVKSIVEKYGGHIDVESEPNKGTTFLCYLKEQF